MTYCLGIKLATGLVAIADTRLTSGTEVSTNKKVSVYQSDKHSIFIMTSGLRSVRDKAITYFKEVLEEREASFDKIYKAVNALGEQVRRVAEEDRRALNAAGLAFNLFAIVGGQLENDSEHKLFLLYPEGNWVEVGDEGSPFIIIGNSGYGKPLLYRSLKFDSSMQDALKIGFLSFDSTRVSSNDVDYPIDVVLYERDSFQIVEHRFEKDDLDYVGKQWSALLSNSVHKLPMEWMGTVFSKLEQAAQ
ncbi:peptidase [Dyadobacter sandarakinus]|uniref:Peptidase n=1 Tax=Dyadobacter sandarakinus TaxID=2747268 RepID=A0ABX7I817_9BACT|nr:peptidase [Dyadobacter sandarakinus]QRR02246.1 peptidase [Dyadobacter sandarakinus]